jgi:DNA-binding MarR family transcriptional regulator
VASWPFTLDKVEHQHLLARFRCPGCVRRAISTATLAVEAWGLMFDYLIRSGPRRTRSLAKRGLTPNDSRALFSLSVDEGRTMRALADAWQCDPSNATWIIDRLEKAGLAERRSVPEDRRVKLVVLTARGEKTRAALLKEFHKPPPELAALDREDLESLRRVLAKLMGSAGDRRA